MTALMIALRISFAGLLGYGLMRLLLRRLAPAGADRAQQERMARGVGLAAILGVIVTLLI